MNVVQGVGWSFLGQLDVGRMFLGYERLHLRAISVLYVCWGGELMKSILKS